MPLSPARRLQHPIPPPTRLSAARSHPSTLRRASVPLAGLWCGAESRSGSPVLRLSMNAERLAHPQAQRAFLGQRAFSVGLRHVRTLHTPSDKRHLPWSGCTSLQSGQDLAETRTCWSAPEGLTEERQESGKGRSALRGYFHAMHQQFGETCPPHIPPKPEEKPSK